MHPAGARALAPPSVTRVSPLTLHKEQPLSPGVQMEAAVYGTQLQLQLVSGLHTQTRPG